MDLDAFFLQPGAPSMVQFAIDCKCNSDQLRQWRHGYANRRPGPRMCVVIEAVSGQKIRRWDLRPDDWHLIWPELIGTKGAPRPPSLKKAA
jgi:hypothetical protein